MPKFQFLSRRTCAIEITAATEENAREILSQSMNDDWTSDDVDLENAELGIVTPDTESASVEIGREHEYTFERSFIASLTVSAMSEDEAREKLDTMSESDWDIGGGLDDTELTCIDDKPVEED